MPPAQEINKQLLRIIISKERLQSWVAKITQIRKCLPCKLEAQVRSPEAVFKKPGVCSYNPGGSRGGNRLLRFSDQICKSWVPKSDRISKEQSQQIPRNDICGCLLAPASSTTSNTSTNLPKLSLMFCCESLQLFWSSLG